MSWFFRHLIFAGVALVFSSTEIFFINFPVDFVIHIHATLIFFMAAIIVTADPRVLWPLPVCCLVLEQFISLPFGVLSLTLLIVLSLTALMARALVLQRSVISVALIVSGGALLYEIFFILWTYGFGASALAVVWWNNFFMGFTATLTATMIFYFGFIRWRRHFNPRYVNK